MSLKNLTIFSAINDFYKNKYFLRRTLKDDWINHSHSAFIDSDATPNLVDEGHNKDYLSYIIDKNKALALLEAQTKEMGLGFVGKSISALENTKLFLNAKLDFLGCGLGNAYSQYHQSTPIIK